jgi:hypothetical protein
MYRSCFLTYLVWLGSVYTTTTTTTTTTTWFQHAACYTQNMEHDKNAFIWCVGFETILLVRLVSYTAITFRSLSKHFSSQLRPFPALSSRDSPLNSTKWRLQANRTYFQCLPSSPGSSFCCRFATFLNSENQHVSTLCLWYYSSYDSNFFRSLSPVDWYARTKVSEQPAG